MSFSSPLKLECKVQHYAWGRPAQDSIISQLLAQSIDADRPCAELWMGAHPSAPALVEINGEQKPLDQLIAEHPAEILGADVSKKFGQLPFLFKVLSIQTALSIQAHPDKKRAEQLHKDDPEHYPDDNHKPEIAIALSPASLLYGFREPAEIAAWADKVPEFAALLGEEVLLNLSNAAEKEAALSEVYSHVLRSDAAMVSTHCKQMFSRLKTQSDLSPEETWVLRLAENYPEGDVGLFSFFILNLATRQPGEGVFIKANIPHAYLEGELIECMANSDNVIRAGLTPKFKDVETLLAVADYSAGMPELFRPQEIDAGVACYQTPVDEFRVERLAGTADDLESATEGQVQLLFCLEGEGSIVHREQTYPLSKGSVYLLPAAIESYFLSFKHAVLFRVLPCLPILSPIGGSHRN